MNAEAEDELVAIATLLQSCRGRPSFVDIKSSLRAAMAWAYRDSARICRSAKSGAISDLVSEAFAMSIESRIEAKPLPGKHDPQRHGFDVI